MISGIFHTGSGLGNQLHRYIATRVLALDHGYDWQMFYPENFKGSFMNLELPEAKPYNGEPKHFVEKKVVVDGVDIRSYDPEFNFIEDGTLIDGEFQDERYFKHRMAEVAKWLVVKPLNVPDDVCVIGFRGGEYALFPELFLTKDYWDEAIEIMRQKNPDIKFEVHTDDPVTARQFFPDFKIVENEQLSHSLHSNMGLNWRAVRYAKYAIIANSSFYILPRLLRHWESEALTLAPRYWARRNTGVWATPSNYYSDFSYV